MNKTKKQSVQDILKEIREKSQKGEKYVFRGEPDGFRKESDKRPPCNSSLYRKLKKKKEESGEKGQEPDNTVDQDALYEIQRGIIEEAREYVDGKGNEIDILAKARHYGGFTNLIDFTSNCLVALYFACRTGATAGRLIMLPEKPEEDLEPKGSKKEYVTYTSNIKDSRLLIQSGVFVHALKGYIDLKENNIIRIEAESKEGIRNCLSKFHNISHKALFNDLHGFIESQRNRLEATRFFIEGHAHQRKEEHKEAIDAYGEAIKLYPEYVAAYINLSAVYNEKGDDDRAIAAYDKAIELNPKLVAAYANRGNVHYQKGDDDQKAIAYHKPIELDIEHAEHIAAKVK